MKNNWKKHYHGKTEELKCRGVYKIYLKRNPKKVYVGSTPSLTSSFTNRFRRHWRNLIKDRDHHAIKLQRTIDKYGIEDMVFEILEVTDGSPDDVIKREQYWIDTLQAFKKGYNSVEFAGCTIGFKMPKHIVNKRKRPICQYDLGGNFIKKWDSITSIIKAGFKFNKNVINNHTKSAGGYMWFDKVEKVKPYESTVRKRVYTYDYDGEFVKEYESILEAAKELDLNVGSICNAINLNGGIKRPAINNLLFYTDDTLPKNINPYNKTTGHQFKVKVTSVSTKEVVIYPSLRQACVNTKLSRKHVADKLNTGEIITCRATKQQFILNKIQNGKDSNL